MSKASSYKLQASSQKYSYNVWLIAYSFKLETRLYGFRCSWFLLFLLFYFYNNSNNSNNSNYSNNSNDFNKYHRQR